MANKICRPMYVCMRIPSHRLPGTTLALDSTFVHVFEQQLRLANVMELLMFW